MSHCRLTALRSSRAAHPSIYPTSPTFKPTRPFISFPKPTISVPRNSPTMSRTYESALQHLDSLTSNKAITSRFTSNPPAAPSSQHPPISLSNENAIPEMLAYAEIAHLTQPALAQIHYIHVAGTKGKGSICAYLTSILTSPPAAPVAGKVGTYTSPHLRSVRERIQINGRPISRELFTRYFFEVWDFFSAHTRGESGRLGTKGGIGVSVSEEDVSGPVGKPFYFRFLTILAFHAFLREGVKTAVIECGIGAEYDSTNILPAQAVTAGVVAQLGLDHVAMLGETVPEIAWNKAGVMREGKKCFTRKLGDGVGEATMEVLRMRAREKKAVLVEVEDREVEEWGGVDRDGMGSLEGDFQKYNQALAVLAAGEHLRVLGMKPDAKVGEDGLAVWGELFSDGLRQAKLGGRCETMVRRGIAWFVDGAHTAESLEEVAKWFAAKRKSLPDNAKVVLLFNQQERDVVKLLGGLLEGIKRVLNMSEIFDLAIFTRNDTQRKAENEPERDLSVQQAAADAMQKLCPKTKSVVVDNVQEAFDKIDEIEGDGAEIAVLATGSLHLVGALLTALGPDEELR
ncbi:FolC bifunctional protein [Annulohypoxylon maeteangense]|uniref:FolC bifunctional protein n=1 Tax=Annulohypoxylon maeteangense TaxID=1927788 RepID=UPI00200897FB|nr:FolC bifunctional protein [Annulohypoxylon maeteangense]KAI0881247.1 FolC bifunctional protein [Annulohypoxylon maeteangense]